MILTENLGWMHHPTHDTYDERKKKKKLTKKATKETPQAQPMDVEEWPGDDSHEQQEAEETEDINHIIDLHKQQQASRQKERLETEFMEDDDDDNFEL